jgi:hypothetical protein
VQCPLAGHEIISNLFFTINDRDSDGVLLYSNGRDLRSGGSTDVLLVDGIKSPDFSLYEESDVRPMVAAWPTVTFEVAYSERRKKLARDCGRYVACSSGKVQLAIGVNIDHYPIVSGNSRVLKQVMCTFWGLDDVKVFDTLEGAGQQLDHLTRCDEYTDKDDKTFVLPAPTKFSCISRVNRAFVKYVVSEQQRYVVSKFLPFSILAHTFTPLSL